MKEITFTLDVEDHRDDPRDAPNHVAITRDILEFLGERGIRGTFFVVGDVTDSHPELARAIATAGHELALHSFRHIPLPDVAIDEFATRVRDAKDQLEDVAQQAVVGFRAPMFSLVEASYGAIDVLGELGFRYSSSAMPIRHPLYGNPAYPTTPFRWANGLVELPCPVLRVGDVGLPFLGAVWLRNFPGVVARVGLARSDPGTLLWTYGHPYDFDPDEPFRRLPEAGRVGSILLWRDREKMFARFDRLLHRRSAPPLVERLDALTSSGGPDGLPTFATANRGSTR